MTTRVLPFLLIVVALPAIAQDACQMANEGGPDGAIVERACRALAQRDLYRHRFAEEAKARANAESAVSGSEERFVLMRKWEAANALLDDARIEMSREMNGVIADTLARYGIAPTEGDGDITGGPGKGLQARWTPRYKMRFDPAEPILNKIELKNGQNVYLKWEQGRDPKERAQAFTWPNGRVDVLDEAFERVYQSRSPRMLGFLLHHESIHFDQLRNGTWKTQNLRETAAYTESLKAAARFGLTALDIKEIKDKLLFNQARVDRQRLWLERTPPNLPPPDVQARNETEWHEFIRVRKVMEDGRNELVAELAKQRADRERMQNAPASGTDSTGTAPEENPLHHVQANSQLFCESPEFITPPSAAPVVWSQSVGRVSRILAVMDLDYRIGTMPCAEYVTYQGIYLHRQGIDVTQTTLIRSLVAEGLIRQTNPTPRARRVTLPQPITAPRPVAPSPRPDPVLVPDVPDPKPDRPTPPPYNPCIHDRCIKP